MIGIIDSGIGGTGVYDELKRIMPEVGLIYFRDTKNFPYGNKSEELLNKILLDNCQNLIKKGARLIVIACNSGSVSSLKYLRSKLSVPIIGLVPPLKPACELSLTKNVALFATAVTCSSETVCDLQNKYCQGVKVYKIPFKTLATNIEFGRLDEAVEEVKNVWENYINKKIDTVVLGCTHYPIIKNQIQKILGPKVKIVEPNLAVAKQVKRIYNKVK